MAQVQNRGSNINLFGASGIGGDVSGPGLSTNNSIARFDGVTGKIIKGSGNNLTFDDTLFAVRDNSDNLLFSIDVISKTLRLDLAAGNELDVTNIGNDLNFGFVGVDAAVSLSHSGQNFDLFFEIFELGEAADVDTSSIQLGWDEALNEFVLRTAKKGTGTQHNLGIIAPLVTFDDGESIFEGADFASKLEVIDSLSATIFQADTTNKRVNVNTPAPEASAVFEVSSTTKGLLAPRLTTVQRDAVSLPASGLLVYNATTSEYNFFDGAVWQSFSGAGAASKFSHFFQEDNAVKTIIASANVFVDINCLLTGGFLEDFTVSGSTITYIGTEAIDVEISFSIAVVPDSNRKDIFRSRIIQNGTTPLNGQGRTQNKPGDQLNASIQTLVLFTVAALVTNDTLDIQLSNGTNGTDATVQEISGLVRQIR